MHKNVLRALTALVPGFIIVLPAAMAQQTPPKWRPIPETITVTAMSAARNLRAALTGTNFAEAFAISASIPVPYSDLNLAREADAGEFDRRIGVAAKLVCEELTLKYPPSQYPIIAGDDCVQGATKDGLAQANQIIATARH
jgi:UrcA family protein